MEHLHNAAPHLQHLEKTSFAWYGNVLHSKAFYVVSVRHAHHSKDNVPKKHNILHGTFACERNPTL